MAKEKTLGVECPKCGCKHLPVLYTRQQLKKTLRYRECRNCGRRVITCEEVYCSTTKPRRKNASPVDNTNPSSL
jgi:transcriptional regulator NrdR family protein